MALVNLIKMETIKNIFSSIASSIKYDEFVEKMTPTSISFFNIIEILILIVIIYKAIHLIKDTRAWVIVKGMFVLFICYVFAYALSFDVIMSLFQSSISIIAVGLIVIFQGDMRKVLEKIGNNNFLYFNFWKKNKESVISQYISDNTIQSIVSACGEMSESKTGALIVIKKETPLDEYATTGILVDSAINKQMLLQVFEHNTPLHDGSIIVSDDRIAYATCYLPLTQNNTINKSLGTRHRAAIGMSESTDALVLTVSEENGCISAALGGILDYGISPDVLEDTLKRFQQTETQKTTVKDDLIKRRRRFLKNKRLKIISVISGFLLWTMLSNSTDPIVTKTITNIPITVENASVLEDLGQTYIVSGEKTASITVRGNRSNVSTVNASTVIATADLSTLSIVSSTNVLISGLPSGVDIIENNNVFTVKIEELVTMEIPVQTIYSGTVSDSLYLKSMLAIPSKIEISGPTSLMNKVDKLVLESRTQDIYNGFKEKLTPVIYDKNGAPIDLLEFTLSFESIDVVYEMLNTKEVDVIINVNDLQQKAGAITSYTQEKQKIRIAAIDETLLDTDSIELFVDIDIDPNADTGTLIKTINLNELLPEGIATKEEEQSFNISIEYETYIEKTYNVPTENISLRNIDPDYNYSFNESDIEISIKTLSSIFTSLTKQDIKGFIDIDNNTTSGDYDITLISPDNNLIDNKVGITVERKQ